VGPAVPVWGVVALVADVVARWDGATAVPRAAAQGLELRRLGKLSMGKTVRQESQSTGLEKARAPGARAAAIAWARRARELLADLVADDGGAVVLVAVCAVAGGALGVALAVVLH